MRIHELFTESFSDARMVFSRSATPDDVIKYIDRFRELSKRNIIKGEARDISMWIGAGWEGFKDYVDQYQDKMSKSQSKRWAKKDSILVHEDERLRVIVPLSLESSCFYGKNTRWCTSANDRIANHWDRYFYVNHDTMFYVLPKGEGKKFAVLIQHDDTDRQIVFSDTDESVPHEQLIDAHGITDTDVTSWYRENRNKIMAARDLNKLDSHIQVRVLTAFPELAPTISNPSEQVLIDVASKNAQIVKYLDNPSDDVLMAAVTTNVRILRNIDNPPEAVQMKAVEKNHLAYTLLKNPTEKVTSLYNTLKESADSDSIFLNSTGEQQLDAKIAKVVMMSPVEYLKNAYAVTDGRIGGSFEGWIASNRRTKDDIKKYAQAMKNGDKFPLPWINYEDGSQDGRNRALAAMSLKVLKIPVGIIPEKTPEEKIEELSKELETATGSRKFRIESKLQELQNQ